MAPPKAMRSVTHVMSMLQSAPLWSCPPERELHLPFYKTAISRIGFAGARLHRAVENAEEQIPRRLNRLLKKSEKQIPRGLNFTPTSAKTALVGGPGSPARDDKNKELDGAPKGAPLQSTSQAELQPHSCRHVGLRLLVRQRIEPQGLQECLHAIDRRRLRRRGRRGLGGGRRGRKSAGRGFLLQRRQGVHAGKVEERARRQVAARFRQLDDRSVDSLQVTPDLQLGALHRLLPGVQGGKGRAVAAGFLCRPGRSRRFEILLGGAALLHRRMLTVGYGAARRWR